ncbi:conserved protein of unknown function (plasmid) [Denitratisoma oestradiolicum]|uniref:Uncharacterized protein n=1 Tax=Denitratisoma oestradiolicum TaxID=311182 RepID=A0A6S6XYP6_9PROT|nr:hypothetical protein [Denitratisoma oestradiolicum]CAB1371181.1 conserved protein of unknown function [Denitratisoma oestradiolicum]
MGKWKKLLLYAAPIPIAFVLSDHSFSDFIKMLGGGLMFWIPYWLACWLSDGFWTFLQRPAAASRWAWTSTRARTSTNPS